MPTHDELEHFWHDYDALTETEKQAFERAVAKFVHDLRIGRFRRGLRVRGVEGHPGVYEMTWAPNGRATFQYGEPIRAGEPHIIWRRIGTHAIFQQP
jgi:hypothetical protein